MAETSPGGVLSLVLHHLTAFYHAVQMTVMTAHRAVLLVGQDIDLGDVQTVHQMRAAQVDQVRDLWQASRDDVREEALVIGGLAYRLGKVLHVNQLDPNAIHHRLHAEVERLARFALQFIPDGPLKLGNSNKEAMLLLNAELEPLRQIQDLLASMMIVAPHGPAGPHVQASTHPDGPEIPDAFWFKGRKYDLPNIPCRVLAHMWRHVKCQEQQVIDAVWGSETGGRALKGAIDKINAVLVAAEFPKTLRRRSGYVMFD